MKKFAVLMALGLASAGAQADGVYNVSSILAYNPFVPAGSLLNGPVPNGGTCTVTAGAVTCTGMQFSLVNANATFNYTNGNWSTTVGGTSVTHTETCIESAGTPCSGPVSGLSGVWNSTTQNGGAATTACPATSYFAAGNCDQVSVIENVGAGTLQIVEQSQFAFAGAASGYVYNLTAVPVPAAVWLFGSALGLLGLRRRFS